MLAANIIERAGRTAERAPELRVAGTPGRRVAGSPERSGQMPVFTRKDGGRLEYRLHGEGALLALTPGGGREAGQAVASLAEALSTRLDGRQSKQPGVMLRDSPGELERICKFLWMRRRENNNEHFA